MDINVGDVAQTTPLHIAVQQGQQETLAQLVKAGADVDLKDKDGLTALAMAIEADSGVLVTAITK
eukprot:SAG31_NODE_30030_length_386_cov_0.898955_1_plen_64_part_10